jgi:probable HAF family extracellular repeat protein
MFAATVCAAFLAFASLILFVGIGAQTAHAAATTYDLTPLGTLGGPTIARGVNASGEVVGQSQGPTGLRAFSWKGGTTPEDLGTLEGGPTSAGRGINDDGLVVGFSRISTGNQQRAFLYSDGTMEPLGTLFGDTSSSEAAAINDNEPVQIVGRSYISPSSGQAFLYSDGTMEPLGTLPGDTYSEAWAINDKGQVVGESGSDEDHGQAFLYSEGAMKPLGTLDGQDYSEAMGINDSGQIVGWSYTSRSLVRGRAFLYNNGEMKDLEALPGDRDSMARAIDEHGRVVGQSRDAGVPGVPNSVKNRAFLWEDGQMTDLNSLISPADPDHPANSPDDPDDPDYDGESLKTLLDAYAIGDSGMIVGSAFNKDGQVRAYLLTPNDKTAPDTDANVSPGPNDAGWNREDVTVSLEATDEGGSNVEGITYSATGAQPIDAETKPGSSAELKITAEGETTVTYSARDHMGNAGEPQTLTVRLDKTAPEINLSAPADEIRDRTPIVRATVRDEADELRRPDIKLYIDGAKKAFSYDEATDRLSRTTGRLSYGKHRVRVRAEDAAGNVARRAWSFRVIRGR